MPQVNRSGRTGKLQGHQAPGRHPREEHFIGLIDNFSLHIATLDLVNGHRYKQHKTDQAQEAN